MLPIFALNSAAIAQQNIAPSATVTGNGANAAGCQTGACSTLNDLNFGTCGTQQMWIYTATPPTSTPGIDWIQWDFPYPRVIDSLIIHHAQNNARSLTGATVQYWDGSTWVTQMTFSNLPQQCINRVRIGTFTAARFRITSFQMTGAGQQSNANFREIEIIEGISSMNNAGVDTLISPDIKGEFCSEEEREIKVRVKNFGGNPISNLKLHWSLNGVAQPTKNLTFTPPLDSVYGPNNNKIVSLGNTKFSYMSPVRIKAWTSLPNGVADTVNDNDTLLSIITSVKQGVFTDLSPKIATICEGGSVVLDAGVQPPNTVFVWNNGSITQKTLATKAGVYTVTVQSPTGCMAVDQATVKVDPRPIAGDFGIIDLGDNNFKFTPTKMQHITYYRWDYGDSTVVIANNDAVQQHKYKRPGTYVTTLTLGNSCDTINLIKQLFVNPYDDATGIIGVANTNEFKLYPNPAKEYVIVESSKSKMNKIEVFNMLGQKVFTRELPSLNKFRVDLPSLSNGLYHVMIFTEQGKEVQRLNIVR